MSSKSKTQILTAIKKNRPAVKKELPEIPLFNDEKKDLLADFEKMVQTAGGNLIKLTETEQLTAVISTTFPNEHNIISATKKFIGNVDWKDYSDPTALRDIDLAIIEGELGVAENGAVWVRETKIGQRVLPFITQHLVVLLDQSTLVVNMTEAYQKIRIDQDGFGVFIAGPSKTADIEQSLVIGAQGARSFTVIIL